MKKVVILIFVLIIMIVVLTTIIFLLVSQEKNLSPKISELEECKILRYGGENSINIVFFSDKDEAEKYSDFFLKTEPFNKNKDRFNFYYIDTYFPSCKIYKGIALLCYNKDLIKKAASCPNDHLVVIKNEDTKIRSSSYMNTMSINLNHPLSVLIHEFGHNFANLADEYVPSNLPEKSINCVESCGEFGESKEGCFKGCSKEKYYRSIDKGVMRTLSFNEYGAFNEKLILNNMGEKEPSKITGFASEEPVNCSEKQYYLIQGEYKDSRINIGSRTIENGCVGKNGAGAFEYRIIMEDNSVIYREEFNPELIFTDSPGKSETESIDGEILKNGGQFLLKVPIIKNSKTLDIFENNNKISEINLRDIGSRPCKK